MRVSELEDASKADSVAPMKLPNIPQPETAPTVLVDQKGRYYTWEGQHLVRMNGQTGQILPRIRKSKKDRLREREQKGGK